MGILVLSAGSSIERRPARRKGAGGKRQNDGGDSWKGRG